MVVGMPVWLLIPPRVREALVLCWTLGRPKTPTAGLLVFSSTLPAQVLLPRMLSSAEESGPRLGGLRALGPLRTSSWLAMVMLPPAASEPSSSSVPVLDRVLLTMVAVDSWLL